MKTRKILLTLMMAALLTAAFTLPAFAATVDLPTEPHSLLSDNQVLWVTDGVDGIATDLTIDQVKAANFLVLEITEVPEGTIQFVSQHDGDGWAWNQNDLMPEDVYQDGKLIFDFSKLTMGPIADATMAKLCVAYYTDDVVNLGITRVYLTDSLGSDSGNGGDTTSDNAKTGDSTVIFFAIGGLLLAAGATVLIARKVKA